MSAVEVGSAYVALVPSAKGFAAKMQAEIGGDVARVGRSVGGDLGDAVGEEGGKRAGSKFGERLKSGATKAAAAAGLAVGAALGSAVATGLSADAANAKLTAQLGLGSKQSERAGKVAGNLYGQGYGEGVEQVNEAIRSVIQNVDGMRKASTSSLERISGKALTVAQVFDQDLGGVTRAVSQMMRTGMAKSADQALDLITVGFQKGADKSEDFLDTLNEYGTQFRKLGISGPQAIGLISQGLRAGARDGDLVADALKEFSIRAIDGSKASAEGYAAIGLNAEKMQAKIARGGPAARAGLQEVLTRLRAVKDPADRSAAAVALFGTQAEDLGQALFKLDPSKATKGLGQVRGAADEANKAFNDTPNAKVATFARGLQQGLVNALADVLPLAERVRPVFQGIATHAREVAIAVGIGATVWGVYKVATVAATVATTSASIATGIYNGVMAASRSTIATWVGVKALELSAWVRTTAATVASTAATVASSIAQRAAAAGAKAMAAGQWLLNAALTANPIGLLVAGLAALVAGLVIAYRRSETFREIVNAAFSMVMGVAKQVADWFRVVVPQAFGLMVKAVRLYVTAYWTVVRTAFGLARAAVTTAVNAVRAVVRTVWQWVATAVRAYVNTYRAVVVGAFNLVRAGVARAMGAVRGIVSAVWNGAVNIVRSGGENIVSMVRAIPGKLRALGRSFASTGRDLIQAFIRGIGNSGAVAGEFANKIWTAVKSAINSGISRLNSLLEFDFKVKGVGISVNAPDIPHLATGGRAYGDTLAVIGDGHEPETVFPDSVLGGFLERMAARTAAVLGAGGTGGSGVYALRITNWDEGIGFIEEIAQDVVDDNDELAGQEGRAHR